MSKARGRRERMRCFETRARQEAAGYEHYEVSSYAKPGARCKHNQIYWENGSWYGFGMSATPRRADA